MQSGLRITTPCILPWSWETHFPAGSWFKNEDPSSGWWNLIGSPLETVWKGSLLLEAPEKLAVQSPGRARLWLLNYCWWRSQAGRSGAVSWSHLDVGCHSGSIMCLKPMFGCLLNNMSQCVLVFYYLTSLDGEVVIIVNFAPIKW